MTSVVSSVVAKQQVTTAARLGPWSGDQSIRLLVGNACALGMIFAGWWQMSGLAGAQDQVGWLNFSIAGLILSGAVNGLWLARGRRATRLVRSALLSEQMLSSIVSNRPADDIHRAMPSRPEPDRFVTSEVMTRYHRPQCLLAAGKVVKAHRRDEHERAGLRPCEVCCP